MLTDLLLNLVGPLAVKRYHVVRRAIWLVAAVALAWLTYQAA
jgi:hypothetical protein